MAQQLRVMSALLEDPGSITSTHMASHNCNLNTQGFDTLINMRHTQAKYQHTLKSLKNNNLFLYLFLDGCVCAYRSTPIDVRGHCAGFGSLIVPRGTKQ